MSKKKLTYSLNYRRPKSEYKPSDELMICIRYYHKCENTQKNILHFFTKKTNNEDEKEKKDSNINKEIDYYKKPRSLKRVPVLNAS